MINGMHVILYSRQAEKVRDFLGDVLGWRSVDAGGGWPIYAAPRTEVAVYPTDRSSTAGGACSRRSFSPAEKGSASTSRDIPHHEFGASFGRDTQRRLPFIC